MRKLMDKIKKNNKGFTLVELIVVVAILAVITVVVAPQYLNYVEKARIGTDENTIGEIAHVAEISWVEVKASDDTLGAAKVTVAINSQGGFTITSAVAAESDKSTAATRIATEINKVIDTDQYKFKSKTYKTVATGATANSVVINLDANGIASWTKVDDTEMGGLK